MIRVTSSEFVIYTGQRTYKVPFPVRAGVAVVVGRIALVTSKITGRIYRCPDILTSNPSWSSLQERYDPLSSMTGKFFFARSYDVTYRSSDGLTWVSLALRRRPVYHGNVLLLPEIDIIHLSVDGETWSTVQNPRDIPWTSCLLYASLETVIYAVDQQRAIYVCHRERATRLNLDLQHVRPWKDLLIGWNGGKIYISRDLGWTWNLAVENIGNIDGVWPADLCVIVSSRDRNLALGWTMTSDFVDWTPRRSVESNKVFFASGGYIFCGGRCLVHPQWKWSNYQKLLPDIQASYRAVLLAFRRMKIPFPTFLQTISHV